MSTIKLVVDDKGDCSRDCNLCHTVQRPYGELILCNVQWSLSSKPAIKCPLYGKWSAIYEIDVRGRGGQL